MCGFENQQIKQKKEKGNNISIERCHVKIKPKFYSEGYTFEIKIRFHHLQCNGGKHIMAQNVASYC